MSVGFLRKTIADRDRTRQRRPPLTTRGFRRRHAITAVPPPHRSYNIDILPRSVRTMAAPSTRKEHLPTVKLRGNAATTHVTINTHIHIYIIYTRIGRLKGENDGGQQLGFNRAINPLTRVKYPLEPVGSG